MLPTPSLILIFSLILLFSFSSARHLPNTTTSPPSDPISNDSTHIQPFIKSHSNNSESKVCEKTCGFLPCTTTVVGNLFPILGYGYLMFRAASYISSGSEILLVTLGPGIVGGLFLPIVGALPDATLILVSGMLGTVETAQEQVSVGMGLLAGSTIMFLTVIWGTCIVVGKCDIEDSVAIDGKDTKGLSLTGSGVTTNIWTSYAAMIMAISLIPFIVVQLPRNMHSTSGRDSAVLIAIIISVLLLISYCLYQVFQPSIRRRRIDYVKHKHVRSGVLKYLKVRALGRLQTNRGEPNREVIEKLFNAIDRDQDGYLSASELRAFIVGIRFDDIDLDKENAAAQLLKVFDTSGDGYIDLEEFICGIKNFLDEVMCLKGSLEDGAGNETFKHLTRYHEQTKREHYLLGDQSDVVVEGVKKTRWTTVKAVLLLLLGAVIAAAFADPLVDAVYNFSSATSIPSFFISFIALPFATNSGQAMSAIMFASRKKLRSASLMFSELYGAATMNNVRSMSVFLALIYARGLVWDFSSEVLVILIVCTVMGALGSIRTTFPLWTSSIAFLLYPSSLALVYVLDY